MPTTFPIRTKWKAVSAVQNNGPDYWVVTTGRWREPAIALVTKEEYARRIALLPELTDTAEDLWLNCLIALDLTNSSQLRTVERAGDLLHKLTGNPIFKG